ncbi:TetR/AcrR family transcriptional regulator [Kribbella sp. VKM Ac-2568]|uniref:TetR/AcrR family transcriptional regulator n=1 Tax=Kribbella sp. VKM Ac-2568 TaxID=2512219 RepID=UPI001051A933|nr:TetR/AcrR family transcriptional regulator [Kribbella sp. VKM Ac-2568]TCM40443.1 TetR family transcriptional regulator [Kribbella sp. VKM Ac-2568]
MSAPSLRARVRSEMSQEIKAVARRHLATDGANLSLRAVARDMDIVASALYRYFPSRDALLTALIIDAYDAVAAAATEADSAVPRDDLRGRWLAVCRAVRTWAIANPAEYGLIYGAPVPGYAAPPDTVKPAARVILLLIDIVIDGADRLRPVKASPISAPLRADLRRLIEQRPGDVMEERLDRVLVAWTHLFGVLNFEVFGRLDDMIEARTEYFDHHMSLMADLTGLPH